MSKKLPLSLVLIAFTVGAFAQTIVSTTPENRKVVLEEFTGIYCTFCPEGHEIARGIKEDYPDDFFIINLHNSGGFSQPQGNDPDFQTPEGEQIRAYFGAEGFPSGVVSRHSFNGNTLLDRNQWATAVGQLVTEDSYVNVAVESDVDVQTREITIHVETYYTGNSPEASNYLTVALLQDNTIGPQTGGGTANYTHNHRLIDIITPTFGEEITTTTSTSFVDRTYTYTIPEMYNNVEAVFGELKVIAFIAESQDEIISANEAEPTYSNFLLANDAELNNISNVTTTCLENLTPGITVKNNGGDSITSLTLTYDINGGTPETFMWTGTLEPLANTTIELPESSFTLLDDNTFTVSINDDEDNTNNELVSNFERATEGAGTIILTIETDQYADEISWDITDSSGMIVEEDSLGNGDNNDSIVYRIDLGADCYTLNIKDSYGDGIIGGGNGVSLEDANGVVHYTLNGSYGSGFSLQFKSDGVLGLEDITSNNDKIGLFPNPATNEINILNIEGASLRIMDARGRRFAAKQNTSDIEKVDVSRMASGTYFVEIIKDKKTTTKKFVVIK